MYMIYVHEHNNQLFNLGLGNEISKLLVIQEDYKVIRSARNCLGVDVLGYAICIEVYMLAYMPLTRERLLPTVAALL